jgi:ubiquinone/menaquinone biosynthesis C-methylase UbiE
MKNPNDMAANYYDKIYRSEITAEMTKEDIKIVRKYIKKGRILDVGCGTGRHMVLLLKAGYEVVGVDTSSGMLKVLKNKLKENKLKAVVLNQNIKKFLSRKKFDGIILFWNTLNEIAISEKEAEKVAHRFCNLLNEKGSVILDFSVSVPKGGISEYSVKDKNRLYKILFQNSYDKKTRISKDIEILEVFENGKRIKYGKAYYTHKWWTKKELGKIVTNAGFSSIKFSNKGDGKMILMLAKK